MTPSLARRPSRGRGPFSAWHRWDGIARATVLGTVFGGLGLVVAVLTWQLPKQTGSPPVATPTTVAATATTAGAPSATSPSAAAAAYLDGAGFPPEAGADRLVEVPRAVRAQAAFAAHPIAIKCPSNQTGDDHTDVTYSLREHYVQFDATVHPYYPPGADQRSVTYVTAMIGTRDTDGTLITTVAGDQKRAAPTAPAALTAAVDGAEKLTIRVQCDDPGGTIVLTDARLTPA